MCLCMLTFCNQMFLVVGWAQWAGAGLGGASGLGWESLSSFLSFPEKGWGDGLWRMGWGKWAWVGELKLSGFPGKGWVGVVHGGLRV